MDSVLPHRTAHPGPTRRDEPQPCHAKSGHGMRPPRTTQNTGRRQPESRPIRSLVTAIWHDKRALHTAVHSHDLQAQHDAQEIAARLDTTRWQLGAWHVRRAKELAQEQQRHFQNPQPYKSLKHVDKVLQEKGHRGIKAVRLQYGTVTNDPKVVLEEVLNSFLRKHNTEDGELSAYTEELILHLPKLYNTDYGELSAYTEELISHLPKLYNRTQRQDMHRTPFTIRELDEVFTNYNREKPRGWTDSRRSSTVGSR